MSISPIELERLKAMAEPDVALILTQNERGELIDARVVEVAEAIVLLRKAAEARDAEDRPPSKGSWWSPGD